MTIAVTIIAFAVLIIFHEFGHFLLARLAGMKVERFSVGFGPTLLSRKVGETEYALCALPLGGYVKIAGMDPSEDGIESDPRAYNNKPAWQRLLVIAAGPFFNYGLGAIIFATVLFLGKPVADMDHARIGGLMPDKPAAEAGLERGDTVLQVEGKEITNWTSFQDAIHPRAGQATELLVQRGDERLSLTITPEELTNGEQTIGVIGVMPGMQPGPPKPLGESLVGGLEWTYHYNVMILKSLGMLFSGEASMDQVQGPVGIIRETNRAANEGLAPFLWLVGLISVNLGLLNLLPIPALDGGRLLFLGAEVVRRKPVSAKIELAVHAIGFMVLIGLILLVTAHDIFG